MTKYKEDFRKFCKCIKKEKIKYHIDINKYHKYSQPLTFEI